MRRDLRPTSRLAVFVLIVAGLVGAQLAQVAHFLLVQHSFCEHGDLVHVSSSVTPASHERRAAVPQADRASAAEVGHDHCQANAVRAQTPEVTPFVLPPSTLTFVIDETPAPRTAWIAIGVLDLAPKSSPPSG